MELQFQHECIQKDVYVFEMLQRGTIERDKKQNPKLAQLFQDTAEMIESEKPTMTAKLIKFNILISN